jgi:hypothetical protein
MSLGSLLIHKLWKIIELFKEAYMKTSLITLLLLLFSATLHADDSFWTARYIGETGRQPLTVFDRLSVIDSDDYFSFYVPRDTTIRLILDDMRHDVNLTLYNRSHRVIGYSDAPGIYTDQIDRFVRRGTYYARVSSDRHMFFTRTSYRLTVRDMHRYVYPPVPIPRPPVPVPIPRPPRPPRPGPRP